MRILVTGGAGYIGYDLLSSLKNNPLIQEIIVYDNLFSKNYSFLIGERLAKVKFIQGDILDSYKLEKVVQHCDIIYHLAAHVNEPYNYYQNLQYDQINKWGTLSVVRAINSTKKTQKLIYVSSTAVYGFREEISLENSKEEPDNAYGKSKLDGEKYCYALNAEKEFKIIRPGNVYGYNPCYRQDSVINGFVMDAVLFNKIKIFGDGNQYRPFIHVKNISKFLADQAQPITDCKLEVKIDFCARVNDIKQLFIEKFPNLEFTYLNQDLKFPSQSFNSKTLRTDSLELLKSEITFFQEQFRINSITY